MNAHTSLRFSVRHCFRGFALGCVAVAAISTHAQTVVTPYVFRHLAGTPGGPGKADGPGAVARFNYATGVAADSAGNVYVTDSQNETIRKISPTGIVTTFAGSPSLAGSADGTGSTARFNYPTGPALDASGNLFVADWANDMIRKITPAGVVSTVAGSPYAGGDHGNADGAGPAARFWAPSSVAVDAAGNVFVADSGNHEIRKIALDGTVTTLVLASNSPAWPAGGFYPFFLFGGDKYGLSWGSQYSTGYLSQIAVDRNGNLYFGNYESGQGNDPPYYLVLKVDLSGVATALSQFPTLTSLAGPALDGSGNLFIGSASGLLRLSAAGTVTTVAGSTTGVSGAGLTITPTGDCIVADYEQVLKITPAGEIGILAGLPATPGSADGTGPSALFDSPSGIAVDANGNCYVADTGNNTIRKITPAGMVTTLAGKAGVPGSADGTASAAQFNAPSSIATDTAGNLYVADVVNSAIRKINADGVVTTLAGFGNSLGLPVLGSVGLAVDASNNIYFTKAGSNSTTISKLTPAGDISVLATVGPFSVGGLTQGLAADRSGNLYCIQPFEQVIRKIDATGNVTIFAGSGIRGTLDGPGINAQFQALAGLAVDGAGNVFVTDGNSIRRITPDGVVSTLGGFATNLGSEDGLGSDAQFNRPAALAVDGTGNIYVADTGNHAVRIGQPAGAPVITTQPQNLAVSAGSSVQFSVKASGAPDPTYQWYFNGSIFEGATKSTLDFTAARTSDAGDYTVVVTNALGSVTSSKATLTISAGQVTNPTTPASGGGGGGGIIGAWFVAVLFLLIVAKFRETTGHVFHGLK